MVNLKILLKRILGVFLIIFGLVALLIPFFPFAWVGFIGLELLGVRALFWDKIKFWFASRRSRKP